MFIFAEAVRSTYTHPYPIPCHTSPHLINLHTHSIADFSYHFSKAMGAPEDLESALTPVVTNGLHKYSTPFPRKCAVVAATSWATLAATFSSTSLLAAAGPIASDLHTTSLGVNLSTAGVLVAMGLSTFVWGPICTVRFLHIFNCRTMYREADYDHRLWDGG